MSGKLNIRIADDPNNNPNIVDVPDTPTSTGTTGNMAFDTNYLYICVATNIWRRTALSTW